MSEQFPNNVGIAGAETVKVPRVPKDFEKPEKKQLRGRSAVISHPDRDGEGVRFHCWGYRAIRGTEPPIVETVAVVERQDGRMKLYHPERVTFTDGGAG